MLDVLLKEENRDILEHFVDLLPVEEQLILSQVNRKLYRVVNRNKRKFQLFDDYKFNKEFNQELETAKPYLDKVKDWKSSKYINGGYMNCIMDLAQNNTKICHCIEDIKISKGERYKIRRSSDLLVIKCDKPYTIIFNQGRFGCIDIPANCEYLCPIPLVALPYVEIEIVNREEDISLKNYCYILQQEMRTEIMETTNMYLPITKDRNTVIGWSQGWCESAERVPYKVVKSILSN